MRRLLLFAALLLVPSEALAVAAQISTSFSRLDNQNGAAPTWVLARCADSEASPSTANGEPCEAGDWTLPVRVGGGNPILSFYYRTTAGTSTARIWGCTDFLGTAVDTHLATNSPASTTSAETAPVCADITAGAGITLNGTTVILFQVDNTNRFDWIVGEIDACTTCDSVLIMQRSR